MNSEFITNIIAVSGIISHVFILIIAFLMMSHKDFKILKWLGRRGILLAFLTSLVAMIGSLYYSDIVGFEPCTLCWYQRIFSYPSVFLLGLALFKKEKVVIPYVILLSGIGALIALYHNFIQIRQINSFVCGVGEHASCTETYFLVYGYITIPMLSFTTFLFTILFLHLSKNYDKENIS